MKVAVLIVVAALVCIVLFISGVVSPDASRRLQRKSGGLARKGEERGARKAGKIGDMANRSLRKVRHTADRSAEEGREINERMRGD